MKKGSGKEQKQQAVEQVYSTENLPSKDIVQSWLMDPKLFTDLEIKTLIPVPGLSKAQSRTEMITLIFKQLRTDSAFSMLVSEILKIRPYLETNQRPEYFQNKFYLLATYTKLMAYKQINLLKDLLFNLGIDTEAIYSQHTTFATSAWEVLSMIEHRGLVSDPVTQKALSELPKYEKQLKRFKLVRIQVPTHLPKSFDEKSAEQQREALTRALMLLSKAQLQHVIQNYDIYAYPSVFNLKKNVVALVLTHAEKTQTLNNLVATLYQLYPTAELSLFGVPQKSEQMSSYTQLKKLDISDRTYIETQVPTQITDQQEYRHYQILLRNTLKLNIQQIKRIAKILEININQQTKTQLLDELLENANGAGKIRILVAAIKVLQPKTDLHVFTTE